MAEKKQTGKAYRPSKEERESVKTLILEAKRKGLGFKAFMVDLATAMPDFKARDTTVYSWWQSVKVDKKAPEERPKTTDNVNVSERLSVLLRKEGALRAKVTGAQTELDTVQAEINELWAVREKGRGSQS